MTAVGSRIGAFLDADKDGVKWLGWGKYVGDEVPPKTIGGFNTGRSNPKLEMDNGDVVWGCECWWGDAEKMKGRLESYKKQGWPLVETRIGDFRGD
jgi:hypothetical protein